MLAVALSAREPPLQDMAEKMSVDKLEPAKEERESEDSMESSPEGEGEAPAATATQENQQPKRKGGRKPVCLGI